MPQRLLALLVALSSVFAAAPARAFEWPKVRLTGFIQPGFEFISRDPATASSDGQGGYKSDDRIGTDRGIGHILTNGIDNPTIFFVGITSRHGFENIVISRLKWDVEIFTYFLPGGCACRDR